MPSSCRYLSIKIFIFCFVFGLFLGLFFLQKTNANNLPSAVRVFITVCGNNIKEEGEDCDGSDLNGQTCMSRGFWGGALSCNTNYTFNTSGCSSGGGGVGGGGGYNPPTTPTAVILQGWAYPNSDVDIIKDGNVVAVVRADAAANFKATIDNITPGIWTFGLSATDTRGNHTEIFSFTMNVENHMTTTISNIFLAPTIDLDKSYVNQGNPVGILGQTVPNTDVSLYVHSDEVITKTTKSNSIGAYFYNLDTTDLSLGTHSVNSRAKKGTQYLSTLSATVDFNIYAPGVPLPSEEKKLTDQPDSIQPGGCMRVNLNCDFKIIKTVRRDVINFIDVSILLYNWGKPKNARPDLNNDGTVNYKDLSILLYYWTS